MNSDDHQVIKNIVVKFGTNILEHLQSPIRMNQLFKKSESSHQPFRTHRELHQQFHNENYHEDDENRNSKLLFNKTGEIEKLRQSNQSFFYAFSGIKLEKVDGISSNLKFNQNSKKSLIRDIATRNQESIRTILHKREISQMSKNVKIISPIVEVKNRNLKIIAASSPTNKGSELNKIESGSSLFSSRKKKPVIINTPEIEIQSEQVAQVQKIMIANIETIPSLSSQVLPPMKVGIAQISYKNEWFLYGGHSEYHINDIFVYSIENNSWSIRKSNGQIRTPRNRSNHSAVLIVNQIYYFGGNYQFNRQFKRRECTNETLMYDIETSKWELLRTDNDDEVQPRRNHSAVVSGGLNQDDQAISDLCLLNLETLKWNCIELDGCDLSDHSIINVTNNKATMSQSFFTDQILCFGGKNNQNQSNNQLRILEYSTSDGMPQKWTSLKTIGNRPPPRHGHIAKIDRIFFTLLIAGGCDNGVILEDLWSLALNKMQWTQIEIRKGELNRFGGVGTLQQQRLLIFGGIEHKGYTNGDIIQIDIAELVLKKKNPNIFHERIQVKKHQSLFSPSIQTVTFLS